MLERLTREVQPPLSIYIHWPWCIRKCPYCDFNSHEQGIDEQRYLAALERDLQTQSDWFAQSRIESVFFGGGTPSLMSVATVERILAKIQASMRLDSDCEITLEANPGALDCSRLAGYRQAGINRISIGVQSFSEQSLQALGRIHGRLDAVRAYDCAVEAGFQRINLDLMYGLPGQNLFLALADLRLAIGLAPEHISWYQLTIEPNTVFYRDRPVLPDEEIMECIDEEGRHLLETSGYRQYEVSAFSRAHPSRHNMNYWQFGDYLALGAGAHGKLSREGSVFRYQHTRMPGDYMSAMEQGRMPQLQEVAPDERIREFFMNVLRLRNGVPLEYYQRSHMPLERLLAAVESVPEDLLIKPEHSWCCTPRGYSLLNQVLMNLFA